MASPLKIGNAAGFWGDQPNAARELVEAQPDLDYLTLDYLAEVSLSIMAAMRAKNSALGYAQDFVEVVRSLCPFWKSGGRTRIITNAGGLNPMDCARACQAVLAEAGLPSLKISVVSGDDLMPLLRADPNQVTPFEGQGALATITSKLVTANAYLGADGIVEALRGGADIVITGRVADPSLTVGPCVAHFGWSMDAYDCLAGATVAGHLIECGTQVTGGFSTDWSTVPGNHAIGFPVAEIDETGACIVTKPAGTGGSVTLAQVKEQLLYEIGDPGAYLSPDVTVSFLTIAVSQEGPDRVRVSGATGRAPPSRYKVSATYRDGFKAHGMLTVFGHDAVARAGSAGRGLLSRLEASGCQFREQLVECLGTGASVLGIASPSADRPLIETVLRISVAADGKGPVERFTKEIAPLVTCGPQGVTGYAAGRPKVLPIFGYWPGLIPKSAARPLVTRLG